jgi:hypothetical protein
MRGMARMMRLGWCDVLPLTLGGKAMLGTRWKDDQEVPDIEGIVNASGTLYEFQTTGLIKSIDLIKPQKWLSVGVLAKHDLYGGRYTVKCGEATAHGSIGVVVLESIQSGALLWSLVSWQSNPFDQIEIKGGYILVLSTSGAVFRFRSGLQDATLSIP